MDIVHHTHAHRCFMGWFLPMTDSLWSWSAWVGEEGVHRWCVEGFSYKRLYWRLFKCDWYGLTQIKSIHSVLAIFNLHDFVLFFFPSLHQCRVSSGQLWPWVRHLGGQWRSKDSRTQPANHCTGSTQNGGEALFGLWTTVCCHWCSKHEWVIDGLPSISTPIAP